MLRTVLEQLTEQDTPHVAPKAVRDVIKKGILLTEGKTSPLLQSISHRLVAGKALGSSTLRRMLKLLEAVDKKGIPARGTRDREVWLLLGGIKGKKWMERVLS